MRCQGCGAEVDAIWRWCPDCGVAVGEPGLVELGSPTGDEVRTTLEYAVDWAIRLPEGTTDGGRPEEDRPVRPGALSTF